MRQEQMFLTFLHLKDERLLNGHGFIAELMPLKI